LALSNSTLLKDRYAHLNCGADRKNLARARCRHSGCLIGRAKKERRNQTCRGQSQDNLADVAESIEYPHRLPQSEIDRRRSIGQCSGGGQALWNARDRDRFWYRGDIRHRRAGQRLHWWRYCSGLGSDDEFSLRSDRIVAADFSAGTAKCDRQIDESGNGSRRDLWLSRTCPRDFATDHDGEIVEGQGPDSGDRRLREIDCAKAAGGGRGARKSHSRRVAVGGLYEFPVGSRSENLFPQAVEITCQGHPAIVLFSPSMKILKFAAVSLLVFGTIAANDVAPSNSELEVMYDKAYRAFDAANYSEAVKQLDAIDARKPDLAASQNLRGVVY